METVGPNEHHSWGKPRFGGGHDDRRERATCERDLERYTAAYSEATRAVEALQLDESLGRVSVADASDAIDRVAYLGRLITWTRERLLILDYRDAETAKRAAAEARADELHRELGIATPARVQTLDEIREENHRLEQAHVMADLKANPALDPQSKEGKARELQRLNESDPAWRAKNGLPPLMDAITAMRNRDR
jgi:hypothetical protein